MHTAKYVARIVPSHNSHSPHTQSYSHSLHAVTLYNTSGSGVCCSVQAGGGRNEVDPRFISLFSAFNATFPSMESLSHIYFSIITGHLQTFKKSVYNSHNYVGHV